jgi:hypothetical protein
MVSDPVFERAFEIMLPFIIVAFAYYIDRVKIVWRPILMFMDVPIALAAGISMLGSARFSTLWWMGIFMFMFAVLLSIGGLWLALNFGKADKET